MIWIADLESVRSILMNAEQYIGSLSRTTRWSRRVRGEVIQAMELVDNLARHLAQLQTTMDTVEDRHSIAIREIADLQDANAQLQTIISQLEKDL